MTPLPPPPRKNNNPLLWPLFLSPSKSSHLLSENPINPITALLQPTTTFWSAQSLFSLLVIVLTKSAPANILSYLLYGEERKTFAKIY